MLCFIFCKLRCGKTTDNNSLDFDFKTLSLKVAYHLTSKLLRFIST